MCDTLDIRWCVIYIVGSRIKMLLVSCACNWYVEIIWRRNYTKYLFLGLYGLLKKSHLSLQSFYEAFLQNNICYVTVFPFPGKLYVFLQDFEISFSWKLITVLTRFLYKNKVYKNIRLQCDNKFKNMLRTYQGFEKELFSF